MLSDIPAAASVARPAFEEALRHVLDNPGSLVRPRMVFRWRRPTAWRAPPRDLAIALEYFHTASLVFDDLPCMDNASSAAEFPVFTSHSARRARFLPRWPSSIAPTRLCWQAVSVCPQAHQRARWPTLSSVSAWKACSTGRASICTTATLPHNRETTERIARGKTVSLIRLTLVLPAMLGGASQRELQLLERIALYWGLATRWSMI